MFKAARLEKIKEIIREQRQVDVSTLAAKFGVSEVTVRSYLEELEHSGFVIRTHGGAIINDAQPEPLPFSRSAMTGPAAPSKEKLFVADLASHIIGDGDVIFLGPGPTCALIASKIPANKKVTIISNSLSVADACRGRAELTLILTGGVLDYDTMTLTGELTEHTFDNMLINRAFLSADGVDLEHGFTVANMTGYNSVKLISRISRELAFVVDSTKFSKTSFMRVGPLDMANIVITSEDIPSEYKSYFFNNGIKIFTSYDLDLDNR